MPKLNPLAVAQEILSTSTFQLKQIPAIRVCNASELRGADGEYHWSKTDGVARHGMVYIRREPTGGSFKFVLAHELAHAWQVEQGLPLDECQADDLAFAAVGAVW